MGQNLNKLKDKDIEEIIEDFEFLGDWEERYRYIIDLGRQLPELPEEEHCEAYKVHGCQSQVWIKPVVEADDPPRLDFLADSDAHIVRGLIALLMIIYAGQTVSEITQTDTEGIFQRLGLDKHLSPTRSNGLHAMVGRIRQLAGDVGK